jgi:hypothetical protein
VVGPQFSDLFWPVACGLWDFFFFKAAGGTRVQAVIPGAPPFFQSILCCSIQRFYTNSHKSLILFYGSFLNFYTNSYKRIHTIVIQIV